MTTTDIPNTNSSAMGLQDWSVPAIRHVGCSKISSRWINITPRLQHNHLNDRDNIVASQFPEGLRGKVDADLKAIYNNLADLFTLTHSPRIREIVTFDSIASTLYTLRGTLPNREAECPICFRERDPSTFWWDLGTPTAKSVLGPCKRGARVCVVCQHPFTEIN